MAEQKDGPRLAGLEEFGLEMVESAARRKGVAPTTVRAWVQKGKVRAVPVGSGRSMKYLVVVAEVDAFEPNPPGAPEGNQNAKKKRGRPRKKPAG